eukprot:203229-Prorocentrum_minimum.AAC.1
MTPSGPPLDPLWTPSGPPLQVEQEAHARDRAEDAERQRAEHIERNNLYERNKVLRQELKAEKDARITQ